VCDYVHLNPVRGQAVEARAATGGVWLEQLAGILEKSAHTVGVVAGGSACWENGASDRTTRPGDDNWNKGWSSGGTGASQESADWKRLRRGWCWGAKEFREEMLELIGQKQGNQHYGEELKESDEQKAQRLLAEMLHKAGGEKRSCGADAGRCGESADGGAAACGDDDDLAVIAQRLAMGHWRTALNATRLIARQKRRNNERKNHSINHL